MRFRTEDEGIPGSSIREIGLLKSMQHINIIDLYDVIHDYENHNLTLIFEFIEFDLTKFMKLQNNKLSNQLIKSFLFQLINGVNYIHKLKIVHRDLKPQNILISSKGVLKIADFGLARDFMIPTKRFANKVVSLWYRSPDVLMGSRTYFQTVDIWSIGCMFAEMASGRPLFPGITEIDQLNKIFKVIGSPTEEDWPEMRTTTDWKDNILHKAKPLSKIVPELGKEGLDLLEKMLILDPSKRITASQALKHSYFNGLN